MPTDRIYNILVTVNILDGAINLVSRAKKYFVCIKKYICFKILQLYQIKMPQNYRENYPCKSNCMRNIQKMSQQDDLNISKYPKIRRNVRDDHNTKPMLEHDEGTEISYCRENNVSKKRDQEGIFANINFTNAARMLALLFVLWLFKTYEEQRLYK